MALAFFDDEDEAQNFAQNRLSHRVMALIFACFALMSVLMLTSYSLDDPSLTNPSASEVQNIFGRAGALIADILIRFVGYSAYIVPLVFAIIAGKLWFGGVVNLLKLLYLPAPMAICAAYLSSWVPFMSWPFPGTGMGGVLGDMLFKILLAFMPFSLGVSLFFSTILLAIMTMLSIMYLCDISIRSAWRAFWLSLSEVKWIVLGALSAIFGGMAAYSGRSKHRSNQSSRTEIRESGGFAGLRKGLENPPLENRQIPASSAYDPLRTQGATLNIHALNSLNPTAHKQNGPIIPPVQTRAQIIEPETGRYRDDRHFYTENLNIENDRDDENFQTHAPRQNMNIQDRIRDVVSRNAKDHEALLRLKSAHEPNLDSDPENSYPNSKFSKPATPYSEANWEPSIFENEYSSIYDRPSAPILPKSTQPKLDFGAFAPAQTESTEPVQLQQPETIVQHNKPNKPQLSGRAKSESEPHFAFAVEEKAFELPPLSLLNSPDYNFRQPPSTEALEASALQLMTVLEEYGIQGEITAVKPGPVVTMFELEPAAGLKASRVIGLAEDIARSMSALTARVATVPGRSVIGIELPNDERETVYLREVLSAKQYGDSQLALPLALGKNIGGEPIIANLQKMPHLLVAGTTGSGKSVAINTMILSLLYHATPEQVRMIMIDPKMLELSVYDDIPHLLSPVVTDPKKAVIALKWAVSEMEERYMKMSKMGVRTIESYNARIADSLERGEAFARTIQTGFDELTGEAVFENEEYSPEKLPYIVVIVDEMADLMMVAGKEIDACIQRLAQMARASGIHLIMATQRPSVDVITGTIKSNFPTRISFQVASKIDSRTILNEMGAEQLLGQGDMLYMSGGTRPVRVHGPFVSDEEVEEVVRYLKAQGEPKYVAGVIEGPDDEKAADIDAVLGLSSGGNSDDELYDQAVRIVAKDRKCSTSYIQRRLSIGYNKAAKIVERMEENEIVSAANHVGKREILIGEI